MVPPSNRTEMIIIGSGITAAAVAWSYLEECRRSNAWHSIIVLESRDLCGGASSRNGGHMKIIPHEQFSELRRSHGEERAAAIIRFQLSHIKRMMELCDARGWDMAECRKVVTVDYFLTDEEREEAFAKVEIVQKYIPELEYTKFSAQEARKKFHVNKHVKGALSYVAGVIHPYRFTTCVWDELLRKYKYYLFIKTHTTVLNVVAPKGRPYAFQVIVDQIESRTFECNHVVHATNAFATQFVPGLRGKLTGIPGTVSMMKPGKLFNESDHMESWSIFYGHAHDYAVQRPAVDGVQGDVILGGGFSRSEGQGASMLGAGGWETLMQWSGIMALTGDKLPFVGRLHPDLTGRRPAVSEMMHPNHRPGEWICAGYNGDGLMLAWLCGIALGIMVAEREHVDRPKIAGRPEGPLRSWFPPEFLPTGKRVRKTTFKNLGRRFFWALLSKRYVEPYPDNDSLDSSIYDEPILPMFG
ncbi:DAO-domain-containing protein [Annulohypoxylon maeteangense]|uniref:DAO-domain-containing protein n=1 Tax=Annulohypoxylon maeteangense TaxID=1927788 RepID=UPI0020088B20|nr:DAO-domain-containing protein [Annulohypoxylon maeteangense]KAI0880109.1 DAO-domain-containing protein [Annulohypoxylon maeteangense]